MMDRHLLPIVTSTLTPLAQAMVKRGWHADRVTILGFALGLLALPFLASEHYLWALFFILINRVFDGLDGLIARSTGATDRGAFLDITLDFLFYALIPLGFAFASPANALPAAFVITSFVATGTSFLAFSLMAERRDLQSIAYPSKGIYYLGGLTEGFETILFFILACLLPSAFPLLAYFYGAACFFTFGLRVYYGYQTFSDERDVS